MGYDKGMKNELINNIKSLEGAELPLRALDYAENLHNKQTRPSSTGRVPYTTHLFSVAQRLLDFGYEDPVLIASALLHDSVEDQSPKILSQRGIRLDRVPKDQREAPALEVLSEEFNERVSEIVGALTNPPVPKELSKEQKRKEYQKHVREILSEDEFVGLIKTSDYLDNAGRILDSIDNPGRASHFYYKYAPLMEDFVQFAKRLEDKDKSKRVLAELNRAKADMDKVKESFRRK